MQSFMYDNMYQQEKYHWWYRGKREICRYLLRKRLCNNPSIADFGCGCGANLQELEKYGDVTGFDISDSALEYCKMRGIQGKLQKIDLLDEMRVDPQFDIGVAFDVLEHLDDDYLAAKNICAYIKNGGVCCITVPANPWLWAKHDENCMHKRRYTKEALQRVVENAGFHINYISYYNSILFVPIVIVRMVEKLFHYSGEDSANINVNSLSNRILYKIFSAEKYWLDRGYLFPFGISLLVIAERRE